MKKQYQSPIARFESLQLRENIATDHCWKFKDYRNSLYYDRPLKSGYTEFKITGFSGNCDRCGNGDFQLVYGEGKDKVDIDFLENRGPLFAGLTTCHCS